MDTENQQVHTAPNKSKLRKADTKMIYMKKSTFARYRWIFIFLLLEAIVILFYGLFTDYGDEVQVGDVTTEAIAKNTILSYYPFFQDIHVMIFIGFGFLMAYLRNHSWTSVAACFVMGAWTIQISILCITFWRQVFERTWYMTNLNIVWLINADFAAASILIAYGGVIGKFNIPQYIIMATIQTFFYALNLIIGNDWLNALDMGGSMYIHTFGAYFGLAVSWMVTNKNKCHENPNNSSGYVSNTFAFIGTIFLWLFWPSFNGGLAHGNAQHRVVINTYLSISCSCVIVFFLSPLFHHGKLHMEAILNATLAGGVVVGACSDLVVTAYGAMLIGLSGGFVSFFGFEVIGPFLYRKIGLHDTAGIHNLHGMPGVLGGIIGAISAGTASKELLDEAIAIFFTNPNKKYSRTPNQQGCYQLAALAVTLGISIFTGIFTGWLLRQPTFDGPEHLFTDREFFALEGAELDDGIIPENEDSVILKSDDNKPGKRDNIELAQRV